MKRPTKAEKKPTGQITSWSPTLLNTWKGCARKAFYKAVKKLPDPGGSAMDRGSEIHGAIEDYIAGRTAKLTTDVKRGKVSKLIDRLKLKFKQRLVRTELFLAFDKNWKQTDKSNSNPAKWLGLKIDAVELDAKAKETISYDWKTGKLHDNDQKNDEYEAQIDLYNVATLSVGLGKEAHSALVFTDAGAIVEKPKLSISLPVLKQAQERWTDEAAPMLRDKVFAPRPSRQCGWCPYSVNNNGPCEF